MPRTVCDGNPEVASASQTALDRKRETLETDGRTDGRANEREGGGRTDETDEHSLSPSVRPSFPLSQLELN